MGKRVELKRRAYEWFLRHHFISETVIIGVVLNYPCRNYRDSQHFDITIRRKKNHGFVSVTISVHETSEKYLVYKIHSRRI